MGIKTKLSTASHPETDGQSKNANQEAEQHLKTYVNHFQNDWVWLLPMKEFSANANVSATIKVLSFLATKSYNPRMSFDPVDLSVNSTREKIANSTTKLIVNRMEKVWNFMREKMTKLQAKQVVAANRHRKEPPTYKIGNEVFLSTKNIRTERPLKKLDDKYIGLFKIKKLVRSLYQLELPHIMKIHDVFYSNLLPKAADNPLLGQENSLLPPTVMNNKEK